MEECERACLGHAGVDRTTQIHPHTKRLQRGQTSALHFSLTLSNFMAYFGLERPSSFFFFFLNVSRIIKEGLEECKCATWLMRRAKWSLWCRISRAIGVPQRHPSLFLNSSFLLFTFSVLLVNPGCVTVVTRRGTPPVMWCGRRTPIWERKERWFGESWWDGLSESWWKKKMRWGKEKKRQKKESSFGIFV